jgi:hypothetical protein
LCIGLVGCNLRFCRHAKSLAPGRTRETYFRQASSCRMERYDFLLNGEQESEAT